MQLHGTLVRGGTSKCWLFDADEVEALAVDVDTALLAAFGAADPRQIDGVGGATSTTSKAALVRRARGANADVEYTFAQVGIGDPTVEWGSNCGNCATAVGLYAVHAGLVSTRHPATRVRLLNTNTGTRLETTVATPGGAVPLTGSTRVPGSRAGGVSVGLSFVEPGGCATGRVLPSGRLVDLLGADGGLATRATLVDAGAPAALAAAVDLGLTGTEPLAEVAGRVPELSALRRSAALAMGLSRPGDPATHAVPKIGYVGAARDYVTVLGEEVCAADYDLAVRMLSMHEPHPTIGLTSAVAVAAAAALEGSVPAQHLRPGADLSRLRIGTPSGVVLADVDSDRAGNPRAVTLLRSARCLASASLYLPLPAEHPVAAATGSA